MTMAKRTAAHLCPGLFPPRTRAMSGPGLPGTFPRQQLVSPPVFEPQGVPVSEVADILARGRGFRSAACSAQAPGRIKPTASLAIGSRIGAIKIAGRVPSACSAG